MLERCDWCSGSGTVECDCTGGIRGAADEDCFACGGSGSHTCPSCGGSGKKDYEND